VLTLPDPLIIEIPEDLFQEYVDIMAEVLFDTK
jgi:hypothetical protein